MEMLVVTTHADPRPMMALQAIRNQNEGENGATKLATAITMTPTMKMRFFPTMFPTLAMGTMNTTDDSRNAVLT